MTVVKIKKQKTKKVFHKKKLKFQNNKNCLKATQPDKRISYLEESKIIVD